MLSSVYEKIVEIVKRHLYEIAPEMEVTLESRLIDLGINSIGFIKIIVEVENEYDFEFNDLDLDFKKYVTIKDFCDYILKKYIQLI